MSQTIEIVKPPVSAEAFGPLETFALDILVGLSEPRKTIPSKYFYDTEGSRLFDRITELPEYYLTNCELDVLRHHKTRIARCVESEPFNLVEFGAGHDQKAGILIDHFLERGCDFQYVPVDIAGSAMATLTRNLERRFPKLKVNGVVAEYFAGIRRLNSRQKRRNLVLFLGSNIGNFNRAQSRVFLRNLWNALNPGDYVLIGFDLKKDIELFLRAYNDEQGVTAAFNLNVLHRINRELGGEFDVTKFRHFGTYDVFSGAMESYLVSLAAQEVMIKQIGQSFSFEPWEPIHMEYSYKYLESDILQLAQATGFAVHELLYDAKQYFVDSLWQVEKQAADAG